MKKDKWVKDLKNRLKTEVGKKCKDFNFNCPICQVWMAYDILEDYFWEEDENII